MTLAVEVVTPEGVVVAADSRSSIEIAPPRRVLTDAARKVFRVGDVAVATWGRAFVARRSIASHIDELASRPGVRDLPAEAVAEELAAFFPARFAAEDEGSTAGFLVGGWNDGVGRTFEVLVPRGTVVPRHNSEGKPGASWRGQTDVVRRLVKGVDWRALRTLADREGLREHFDALRPLADRLEYLIPFRYMNVSDAVEFASFAIATTIGAQRFTHGTRRSPGAWPGVGGGIDVAVVTADGFSWRSRRAAED